MSAPEKKAVTFVGPDHPDDTLLDDCTCPDDPQICGGGADFRPDVCPCTAEPEVSDIDLTPHECPKDHRGITIHDPECLLDKHEKVLELHEPDTCECLEPPFESKVCECCGCIPDRCLCKRAGREVFDEWKANRPCGALPAVLESTHPLMQKFQATLKIFLEKENALANDQIVNLKADLQQAKVQYDADLETIYRDDCDTNAQRTLIEEYEATLANKTKEREEMEAKTRALQEKHKIAQEKLAQDQINERESQEEQEALANLVRQLEKWREETESDLTINQRMSDKMRIERKTLAEEKRQLDMIVYTLTDEVWKLESRLELMTKQMEIKNTEIEQVRDRVTAYSTELADLDLDKRRLMALWRSVVVNIGQRDKVYMSVRDDYNTLQENYITLMKNLEVTKKMIEDEILRSKELAMKKDKIAFDKAAAEKLFEQEDLRRVTMEEHIAEMTESIEMIEKNQEMMRVENNTLRNAMEKILRACERVAEQKLKMEAQILANIQECLLNDKAVQHMANGIKKIREMSAKLEIALMEMENQHAKTLYDIEVYRFRQVQNNNRMEKVQTKIKEKEDELNRLQEKYDQRVLLATKKQRELHFILKKYAELKDVFELKSPQEIRIQALEQHIKLLREKTEELQQEWLRHQGHVVKMTHQHQKIVTDINLILKQNQICEQKATQLNADIENLNSERARVERTLRTLQGRLQFLERTRNESLARNKDTHASILAITHEYTANLKDAESAILELEEEIENLEKEKVNLLKELDRTQREALVWQRKGIQAVELKRNIKNAASATGEIGQMKNEIHKMEVRREQLRRMSETLSTDLAKYVTRRDNVLDKARASAAVEKATGTSSVSQFNYKHKLRLAKADTNRVAKELADAKENLEFLKKEHERLEREAQETWESNRDLEERVAQLLSECRETDRRKQYLLERVVRNQRLGTELTAAVHRQSLKTRKPKAVILAEYENALTLNDRLKYMVEKLTSEFPHLEDKMKTVMNTLTVMTPVTSPREDEPPEKPLEPCMRPVPGRY